MKAAYAKTVPWLYYLYNYLAATKLLLKSSNVQALWQINLYCPKKT